MSARMHGRLTPCGRVRIAGKPFKFAAPHGDELPPRGYDPGEDTYQVRPCGVPLLVPSVPETLTALPRGGCRRRRRTAGA
jgi:hypothetical protein